MNEKHPKNGYAPDIVLAFILFLVCILLALFYAAEVRPAEWVGL